MLSRRRLLVAATALPVAFAAGGCARGAGSTVADGSGGTRPLPIPPVEHGSVDAAGVRRFALTVQAGNSEIVAGKSTPTWGYNGAMLGPTLRARRGETVAVAVRNTLGEATSVHWHGMHVPASCDGGPHQMIAPGGQWNPSWRIEQPAATLWYHPHPHGNTEKHVYRGLSGLFLIDDEDSEGLPLPREYGVDDIPVVLQDKTLTADGTLDERRGNSFGLLGTTMVVNGISGAHLEVRTERVRLRLLNGSSSRVFQLGFSDDRRFDLVATDGGLLTEPVALQRITLSPGERAEIVVAARGSDSVVLRALPVTMRAGIDRPERFGFDDTFDVLTLRAGTRLHSSPALPAALTAAPAALTAAAVDRTFDLKWFMINGLKMDMNRIDMTITTGATEVWAVRNLEDWPHNFHVHDTRFRIRAIDGAPPPPELAGFKDTVYTEPGRTYELVMHFPGPADPTYPYMFHCHLLHHEDAGMMGQFLLLDPGQQATPMTMPADHAGMENGGHGGH
ncbi:multicopper oxidase family protein [Nocardia yamanashiensis]|uniref:multicopper oxidase family protein n=1 Tax=Nocardia yamanashiensis TaxID=209247 RepID=UPI0008296F58|nr:multicopper oxidase domain-containing protein [Nocardia yamanashiensis]